MSTAAPSPYDLEGVATPDALPRPLSDARRARTAFASLVSLVLSPPLLAVLALIALGTRLATPRSWAWIALTLALVVLAPALYVALLVSRGEVSDFDLSQRSQRTKPFLVALAALALACGALALGGAPALLRAVALAGLLLTAVMVLVTLRWKISLHAACAAASVVVLGAAVTLDAAALALLWLALVPLTAWSRVHLGRHSRAQVLAGAALGTAIPATLLAGWLA